MIIQLNAPFASNGEVDGYDVKQMKRALNRLGYYIPYEKTGITDIPDRKVFEALKSFQEDTGLTATGTARPGDETVRALNKATGSQQNGQYIWRTVGDDKVRDSHAALNGTIRNWDDDPAPGEEHNCRCWAEPVFGDFKGFKLEPILPQKPFGLKQILSSKVNDSKKKWTSFEFLKHFFAGNGEDKTLSEVGYLSDIIEKAEEIMFHKVEEQVADEMRNIKNGGLIYRTENSYPRLGEVKWVFGGGVIETLTTGKVTRDGNILYINAQVEYTYYDEFTDIADIRQLAIGPHRLADLPTNWLSALGVTISEIGFGRMYLIQGKWKTDLSGSIYLEE